MPSLTEFHQLMLAELKTEMMEILRFPSPDNAPLFQMMQYHMGWVDASFQPLSLNPGKQIRPFITLLATEAAGGDWRQAVPIAAAIELLHNFSLIHDDIQDISPLRRGRPTVWKLWGIPLAINAGDAMFAAAHLAVSRLVDRAVPASVAIQALKRFDETCLALTKGQDLDMRFETEENVTPDQYIEMIHGKTAVLISLSLELGALIGNAPSETIHQYAQAGEKLGLAFQIRDDILGIWGQEADTGKSAATDIATRKKSFPILYGLAQSAPLTHLYAQEPPPENFVSQAITLLEEVHADQYAQTAENRYAAEAIAHLNEANESKPNDAFSALTQLANQLLGRSV